MIPIPSILIISRWIMFSSLGSIHAYSKPTLFFQSCNLQPKPNLNELLIPSLSYSNSEIRKSSITIEGLYATGPIPTS